MSKELLVIGCGPGWPAQKDEYKQHGTLATGLDFVPAFQPDVVRDVRRGLPFSNNTFDEVIIEHVLEHISGFSPMTPVDNYDFVMSEIHRVLKKDGIVKIEVPYWRDDIAVEAAGHIRLFTQNSFMNYYENPHWEAMGQCHFERCLKAEVVESGRSGEAPARVVKVELQK